MAAKRLPNKKKPKAKPARSIPVLKLTDEDLSAMREVQLETGITSRSEVLRQAVRIGLPIFREKFRALRSTAA